MAKIIKIAMPGFYITPFVKLERTRYCLMFIKARVNSEHEALLLIDTAASTSVLTREAAQRMGLSPSDNVYAGHTVDDEKSFRYQKAALDHFEVADRAVENFPALISERTIYYANSHYEAYGVKNVDGLLGADFLGRFVVSFDATNDEVEFHLPQDAPAEESPAGQSIDFLLNKFAVIVEVEVTEGVKANFLLDTGAASSIFSPKIAEALNIEEGQMETINFQRARGIGGRVNSFVALRHEAISLSGIEIPTEFVIVRDLDYSSVFKDIQIDGILGGHLLYNFRATLDYANKKLLLDRVA